MRRLIAAAGIAMLATAGAAFAGFVPRNDSAERTLMIGDVLEIVAVTPENAAYGWVLTRDGQFVEAGRDRVFRTRLTQPGKYLLEGSMRTTEGENRLTMNVTALPLAGGSASSAPDTADIAVVDGLLNPVTTLTPAGWVNAEIRTDLNPSVDTDGDGNPGNDQDLADTLFSREHNTVSLWFAEVPAEPLALSTTAQDGTTVTQRPSGDSAVPVTGTDSIETGDELHGTLRFVFPLPADVRPEDILYQWDFGDGGMSFTDAPVHKYARNGDFTVSVTVRQLSTANVMAQGQTTVSIKDAVPAPASSQSSAAEQSSVPAPAQSSAPAVPTGATSGAGDAVLLIVKLTLVLLAAIVLGVFAVWAGRRFLRRESRLQKTLADAEAMLVTGKDTRSAAEVVEAPPPPMTLRKSAEETASATETEITEPAEQADLGAPAEEATPPWLQHGLEMAKDLPGAPVQQPEPALETPEPAMDSASETAPAETPAPESAPEQASTPSPEPAAEAMPATEELPPWLQNAPEEPADQPAQDAQPILESAAPEPTPAPQPLPAAPQEPGPADTVTEAPVAQPAAPVTETTAPTIAQPAAQAPETPPAVAQPAPAAGPPDSAGPIATLAASAPTAIPAAPSPAATLDAERLERERERKRRKRQRYRENLKKRQAEEKIPKTSPPPTDNRAPVVSAAVAPASLTAAPTPPQAPAPEPQPSAPSLAPTDVKTEPQDIPPLEPQAHTTAAANRPDDQVAFVIKADSISQDTPPPPAPQP